MGGGGWAERRLYPALTCRLPVRFMAEWDAIGTTTSGCDVCGSGALADIKLRRRRGDLRLLNPYGLVMTLIAERAGRQSALGNGLIVGISMAGQLGVS